MFRRLVAECRHAVTEREVLTYGGASEKYHAASKVPPSIVVKGRNISVNMPDDDELKAYKPPKPKKKG